MGANARWADEELLRKTSYTEVSLVRLGAATVESRWGRWVLGAGAPPSLLSHSPPAPPTTLVVPCACAQTLVAKHCIIPAPLSSHPPSSSLLPRARMTHSPPPWSLVTQSHFRVQQDIDPQEGGSDGGGAVELLSGGCKR